MSPAFLHYWGKAHPDAPAPYPQMHLVAYYALDVAACVDALLDDAGQGGATPRSLGLGAGEEGVVEVEGDAHWGRGTHGMSIALVVRADVERESSGVHRPGYRDRRRTREAARGRRARTAGIYDADPRVRGGVRRAADHRRRRPTRPPSRQSSSGVAGRR